MSVKHFLFLSLAAFGTLFLFFAFYYPLSDKAVYAASININASIPSVCGNNVFDTGEQCDGSQLGGQTCVSQGYSGGTLACKADCTFNVSACTVGGSGGGSGGGGGGGGGGYFITQTQVTFRGRAYPLSRITLLKDAQVAVTTVAGGDASFQITLSNLSGGNYIFSLYSEDKYGVRSSLLTFPVSIISGATTNVTGIFVAPTIRTDKEQVKRGDDITILGQSSPQADIVILVSSEEEYFGKAVTDKEGVYLYNFNTSALDLGSHLVKSKASIGNLEVSGYGNVVNFTVGNKNVAAKTPSIPAVNSESDLNGDKKVNLVDFSVIAYWYKRTAPPANVDLNKDGKINLVDFSILAFNWTG